MTHDTRFSVRFQSNPAFLRAAVVYDFIPLEWPGYLPGVVSRVDYLAKMARLRSFDCFLPISEYTAWRLSELLGVSRSRIHVTGASVRRSLYELRNRLELGPSPYNGKKPYFLIVVAGDARKNPEVPVKAVRHLNLVHSRPVSLKVVGHYDDTYKRNLLRLAGHAEGAGFLEFCPGISDEELVSLFAGAVATIAPSHIEGFSLPVVEAAVCGCPVVASTCAAHLELIDQTEALFPSDDSTVLSEKLEDLLNEPSLRASLVASQAHLGSKFHEDEVGKRFWSSIAAAVANRRPNVTVSARPPKPRLAFLSPYPPDRSGVARYTAMTMQAGEKLFDSDLYSDAPRPLTFEGSFRDAGRVTSAPLINGRYNGVISVLGNHACHTTTFETFEKYGGPCILHDARLTQIYFQRLGEEQFLKFAAKLLGRSVSREEVQQNWLQDRDLPSLFLEPIVERAAPLIVHTKTQQAEIKKRYGIDAHVTTSCPTAFFEDEELTTSVKMAIRERHGIPANSFLISSFGIVDRVKGMEACIIAIEFLRSWNIPAELRFLGCADKPKVDSIATMYGIAEHVRSGYDFVDDATYRDFLIASDAAVQLRTYGFGQLSASLTDCISAGLPCVASANLAESCDSPGYVSRVPDKFSPLQIAEQLALIWEAQTGRGSHAAARAAYLETHNFDYYAKRLIQILGIA